MAAARELFAARSYRDVTTQEVAQHAGVSETLIFRYFHSKAGLFSLAVLTPAMEVMDGFVSSWTETGGEGGKTNTDLVEQFVSEFFDSVAANRALFTTVMHIVTSEVDLDRAELRSAVADLFGRVEGVIEAFAATRGVRALDAKVTARSVLLFVGSTAVLWPYTFAEGVVRPSDERVKAELTTMLLRGIESEPSD